MLRLGSRRRTVHIHLGPHKTGSTAVKHALESNLKRLAQDFEVAVIPSDVVEDFARAVNAQQDGKIEAEQKALLASCNQHRSDIVLSCADLAGHALGLANTKRAYTHLWPNMNRLRKAFKGDDVKFYVFVRDPEPWLRDVYVNALIHGAAFKSYEAFLAYLRDLDDLWDGTLQRVRERVGDDLVEVPYDEGDGFSPAEAFFQSAFGDDAASLVTNETVKTKPSDTIIPFLESANKSGASSGAIQAAKEVYADPPPDTMPKEASPPPWPPAREKPNWLSPELESLWSRVEWRGFQEDQPNLMPDPDADLSDYRYRFISANEDFPEGGRNRMEDQVIILRHRMKGLPETCFLLGLAISYLRRHTGHEDHASRLFQRLWAQEYPILLGFLQTRWLISTFQTFMDHGVTEDQRSIGAAAYFFSNTLKMYEAERALEGLPSDSTYPNTVPATKQGFWGLDRYGVGGTDMLLNTNALLLELAARDPLAGRVVQEFMLRVKRYDSAFSRMDNSRLAHQIDQPRFANCWSFFEPPKKDR